MAIWFSLSRFAKDEKLGDGFINCPVCKARTLTTAYQCRTRTSVFGVPVSTQDTGPETYQCHHCRNRFDSTCGYPYDFSLDPTPPDIPTRCPTCSEYLPADRLRCPNCGHRIDG